MYVRISLKDAWIKTSKITLIKTKTKKGGWLYNISKTSTEQIISALENNHRKQK